jgi:hypothetical protein
MKATNLVLLTVSLFTSASINAWSQSVPTDSTSNPQATIAFYNPKNIQAFLASNKTDKTLCFILQAIEVKIGSQWKSYSDASAADIGETLSFKHSNPDGVLGWLAPHETGYGFLESKQPLTLPKGVVWRAKFTVQEQLTGGERAEAAAKSPVSPAAAAPVQPIYHYGPAQVIYSGDVGS